MKKVVTVDSNFGKRMDILTMYDWTKNKKINRYIDLLGEAVNDYEYPKYLYDIQKTFNEKYDIVTKENLLKNLRYIKDIEEFKVALFVERSVFRKLIYSDLESDYTFMFKMFTFSLSNAKLLKWISTLAAGDAAFFFIGNIVFLILKMSHPGIVLFSFIIVFAGVAISVASAVLYHLVLKAAVLQDQSDLTI